MGLTALILRVEMGGASAETHFLGVFNDEVLLRSAKVQARVRFGGRRLCFCERGVLINQTTLPELSLIR